MKITVGDKPYQELNHTIRHSDETEIELINVVGQRYIGDGLSGKNITIQGTPGNALGAYMNGANITVHGNGQDATGDTMNCGRIVIHGNCGDTTGYGMRGGEIYIKGYGGYRVGIHMKEYKENKPMIILGGRSGDFLGEYLAGGILIVLGIGYENTSPVGRFCGTGMHGGAIYIRSNVEPEGLPKQVSLAKVTEADMPTLQKFVSEYCRLFDTNYDEIMKVGFYKLTANSHNPYKQLYTKH